MKIFVVRHSVREDGPDYDDDPDPPLTPEGKKIARAVAKWMADPENDAVPNLIITSPFQRTYETAEILADELGLSPLITEVTIGPFMSIKGLCQKLALDPEKKRVCIVSHHESIEHGLRVMNREPWQHLDMFAMGELRSYRLDRSAIQAEERFRIAPSDIGLPDYY